MRSKLLAIAVIAMFIAVPLAADTSDADAVYMSCAGADITIFDNTAEIQAGRSSSLEFTFMNSGTGPVSLHLTGVQGDSPATVSMSRSETSLAAGKGDVITVTLTADKLARHGTYTSYLTVTGYNYGTGTDQTVQIPISVVITSTYSSDSMYNRVLGLFGLPDPLDTPEISAAVTMVLWLAIAAAAYCVLALITARIFRNDSENARSVRRKTGTMLAVAILLGGASNALMVYGADERFVAYFRDVSTLLYIPIIAYIVWNIYTNIISHVFHKMEKDERVAGADTSLIPLFNMIGKIIIAVVAVAALLRIMGFDLVAIITGAGIAGMAISLGAQNTLTEFFAGLNLLTTRPFKRGDIVKIGGDDIYEVKRVGLINSRFKNWTSLEQIVMPNSMVSNSTITNITGKGMAYRIFLYFTVAYGSDVERTKEVILEAAYNHPQVITDGSYSKPSVALTAFLDSAIEFRLAVYITDFRDNIWVSGEINENVYRDLEKAGIEIPYNKLDVYVRSDERGSKGF